MTESGGEPIRPGRGVVVAAIAVVASIAVAAGIFATGVVGPTPSPTSAATSPSQPIGGATGPTTTSSPSASSAGSAPASPSAGATAGTQAFIRVNQVGYDVGFPGSRRAFLLAPVSAAGETFEVLDASGLVVFSGPVPAASLGAWSKTLGFVYPIDFGYVAIPGTYTIVVAGSVSATSPAFRVDSAAKLYAPLLSNALAFYRAQRDGPDVISSVLDRQPAHLHDKAAFVYARPVYDADGVLVGDLKRVGGPVDASGGWADAGDYVKFVQTTSYVVDVMLAGIRDDPRILGGGSAADFTGEARFGVDWLLKMWDDRTRTLYYQVGIGDGNDDIAGDHDSWRLPQDDDAMGGSDQALRYVRHRPVLRAGPPASRISPNLAGRLAAAFAECSQVFRATDRPYADRCLTAAEHIYALADTSPRALLSVAPFDFYPETQWRDDMELGATELATAVAGARPAGPTVPASHAAPRTSAYYLGQAAHWAAAYVTGPKDFDSLNLYDVAGLAHYELARAMETAGNPKGLAISRSTLIKDMRARLDAAIAHAAGDPFGFGGDYANFDSASHALGLATMASQVDELTGTSDYAAFGRRQLDVLLGSNAWGVSLIVGAGTTFPHCIHHQIANLVGALDGTAPLLLGAVVNGPNGPQEDTGLPDGARACSTPGYATFDGRGGVFIDEAGSWPTVEPAIDFAAGQLLAFARAAADLR